MDKLQRIITRDSSIIALLLVLGIAGLILFHFKQESIFPNASIDLSIGKPEIMKLAREWAARFGFKKQGLIESIVFGDDDQSKTFLEYELGNSQANSLMRDTVPIFFWQCRFRKPLDQETMDVQISPTGQVLAVDLQVPNDKKLPSISHAQAESKAFAFVKERLGWNEKDCKLSRDETKPQLNRTDHSFTWELEKLDWHGAKLRADVDISGDSLSGFNYYLKRPQKWDRDYSTIRSRNELLESVASIFYFALYPIGIFIFLRGIGQRTIRLRFSIICGIVLTSIFAVEYLNNFEEVLSRYSSDSSYKLFVVSSIAYPLLSVPFIVMLIAALAGAGELIYRRLFADKIALENILTKAGLSGKQALIGLIAGVAAFGLSLGYQIIYYSLGGSFHFWCPLEVGNYQALSAYFPWFSAVSLGSFAASNEEILYRVLLLGLSKRVFRSFWIANILQAAAWGFMHSTYPQQPCYARGVELTIEGIFDGWLLRRFGLLACVVSHYSFDAFQCVTPLFNAPVELRLSAVLPFLPIVAAIIYCLFSYQREKLRPENEAVLLNKAIEQSFVAPSVADTKASDSRMPFTYKAISNRVRGLLVGLILIGVVVHAMSSEQSDKVGGRGQTLSTTKEKAIEKAKEYLTGLHLDITDYKIASSLSGTPSEDRDQIQYLFEQLGLRRTRAMIEEIDGSYQWVVRFVKPLTPEEYSCRLDANGLIMTAGVKLGEDAVGAKLDKASAQTIAEEFLRQHRSVYVPFEFEGGREVKRKNRIDHHFIFRVPKYKVGDAALKIGVDVLGNLPGNTYHFWQLPDKWQWERSKRNTRMEIAGILSALIMALAGIAFIGWVVSLFRAGKIRWRLSLALAALACFAGFATTVNGLPGFFNSYQSTIPLNTWLAIIVIGGITSIVIGWGVLSLIIAVILAGNSEALKLKFKGTLSALLHRPLEGFSFRSYRLFYLDALVFACSIQSISVVLSILKRSINLALKHEVSLGSAPGALMTLANQWCGPLQILLNLLMSILAGVLVFALAIALCRLLRLTTCWRFLAAGLLIYAIYAFGDRYWQDFLAGLISTILSCAGLWWATRLFINRNYLTFLISIWLQLTYGEMSELWQFGRAAFFVDFIVSCILFSLPFLYLFWLYLIPFERRIKSMGKLS